MSINLTPLLDVVLQLITFFMMLIHFGSRIEGASLAVRLPTAPAALPTMSLTLDRLVVGIDAGGRLLTDRETIDAAEAGGWWAEQAARRRRGRATLGGPGQELPTRVVIRADRAVAYGVVRRTMASAQQQGFAHFTLVVHRERSP